MIPYLIFELKCSCVCNKLYPVVEKIQQEGKFLRVVLLSDGETIHNAFFDRSFKEELK